MSWGSEAQGDRAIARGVVQCSISALHPRLDAMCAVPREYRDADAGLVIPVPDRCLHHAQADSRRWPRSGRPPTNPAVRDHQACSSPAASDEKPTSRVAPIPQIARLCGSLLLHRHRRGRRWVDTEAGTLPRRTEQPLRRGRMVPSRRDVIGRQPPPALVSPRPPAPDSLPRSGAHHRAFQPTSPGARSRPDTPVRPPPLGPTVVRGDHGQAGAPPHPVSPRTKDLSEHAGQPPTP